MTYPANGCKALTPFTLVAGVVLGWTAGASGAWAAGPPASLTLTPASAEIGAGETMTFTSKLLDSGGQETSVEANSHVGFAIDVSSFASVTPNASDPLKCDVLGKRPGMTPLRAFYVKDGAPTNISASSDVTVVEGGDAGADAGGTAGSGGGAGSGGAAGSGAGTGGAAGTGQTPSSDSGSCAIAQADGPSAAHVMMGVILLLGTIGLRRARRSRR